MKIRVNLNREGGYSLIEAIISVTIIMIGMSALASLMATSMQFEEENASTNRGMTAAKGVMEIVLSMDPDQITTTFGVSTNTSFIVPSVFKETEKDQYTWWVYVNEDTEYMDITLTGEWLQTQRTDGIQITGRKLKQ